MFKLGNAFKLRSVFAIATLSILITGIAAFACATENTVVQTVEVEVEREVKVVETVVVEKETIVQGKTVIQTVVVERERVVEGPTVVETVVVEKEVMVEVEKEVLVEVEKEVVVEVEKEVIVEVEKIVTATPESTAVAKTDDVVTHDYVQKAIAYYEANGLDATVDRYRAVDSAEDGRTLTLIDKDKGLLLVYHAIRALQGQYVGPGSRFAGFQQMIASATEDGYWGTARGINQTTKQEEPRRILSVLHDGLIFVSAHSVLAQNVEDSTKEYVNKAIAKYEKDGLDATIAHYNSQESLDGQFYLFLIGANDNYLAHPIFPHLIGTDIKDVVGSDGQELGKEIAEATEGGIWVEYLWPHPESRKEQQKVTWSIRHDGLIFSSGYYAGGPEAGTPAWQDADPREYTVDYVNRAVERYERDGLQSMINYYNSVASFEGEWYLFATDENDIYHVHPLIPRLRGTDINDVVGSDGYELGKALAAAEDGGEGVWVEYLWPHPVTLKEVPKVGYAVRRDGMLFASGYYVQVEDPAAHTKAYVQQAIDYYKANGLEATIAHYNSADSVDGQWSLTMADGDDIVRVAFLSPNIIGTDLNDFARGRTRQIGEEMAAATEEGTWVNSIFPNVRSSETLYQHTWAIRYDGLLFTSRYYDDKSDVPDSAKTDDALTRAYVQEAIERYQSDGPEAAFAYYNSRESHEGERALFVINEASLLSVAPFPALVGSPLGLGTGAFPAREEITEEGIWANLVGLNPATGAQSPMRAIFILHDGLVFASGHFPVRENVEEATQDYVNRAIKLYQRDGLEATVDYYNSQASLEGQLYLFLIDADDKYVAHPIFPHLIGTDIKDVIGSDGQELGKEIAQATREGIWVEYLWPHPISRKEGEKVTWAIRHDEMIFASGYYAGRDVEGETAPWEGVDPREYTENYVNRAIEHYERDGLESMLNYYNSVASFEGEWYLFATDENDIYIVHALFPRLKGTDIKEVVGSDGYELGEAFAAAQDGGEGVWVEYLWPHPVTLKEVRKVGYAVRRDGMLFASGYYPEIEDPVAYTQKYVADAIDYYKANGLDATIEYYNSRESVDSQWWLTLVDENYLYIADAYFPHLIGTDGRHRDSPIGIDDGVMLTTATEKGAWHDTPWFNPNTSERLRRNLWVVRYDGLIFISSYFTAVGEPGPEESADDVLTRNYVQAAIAYYDDNGRDATVARYRDAGSIENDRPLTLIDADKNVLLVYHVIRTLEDQYVGPGSRFAGFQQLIAAATEEGSWVEGQAVNRTTKQEEPRRLLVVLHDGLVFISSHSVLRENVEDSTKEYVQKAIAKYEKDGLDATIAHYNSQESLDGQFYLFLIGADDNYLAHPIFPHLIGTDIKDVVGSDGQELGKEIAQATEEGIWVEYLWPHPISRKEQQKVTWSIRHDGLIFSSGYYAGGPEAGTPAWQDADPREYTVDYVNRAIERYERDGLQSMIDYYNSVASFEGEWYLFATDANDIYHVHPLISGLIGGDIKDVVGSDGYELGEELAKATEEGVWVEYLWPHPVTLKEVPKVGYAVRRDGMLFASGYYVQVEDPAAHTKAYVQSAIEYYQANGLDAMVEHYSSADSVDGQWNLTLADADDTIRVAFLTPGIVGTDLKELGKGVRRQIGAEMAAATEDGAWVSVIFPNTRSSETLYAHTWAIRYDGLLFTSRYYDDKPDVRDSAKSDDTLTREFVQKAIAYFEANGLDATVAHYNDVMSVEGERSMMILRGDDQTVLATAIYSQLVGSNSFTGPGTPLGASLSKATSDGYWITDIILVNPTTGQQGRTRFLVVRHGDLIFGAPHFIVREEYAKDYVRQAMAVYDREGLEATIAHYDSPASLEGEFYLFLIGADDLYLAHPILPHLKGTDIKAVKDSSGYALGVEIAKATEDGHWVEYLWPNPVTRIEEPKSTWVVRHDGLIFATGYYTPDPDATPAWKDVDPREYTVTYVENAIARYDREGLEALQSYYTSVGSFEGQWYLFATDADDIYVLHPLISRLIGTDIKDVTDSTGYELGKEIAKATEDGIWVEYLWPHPFTLKEVPKIAYAVRHKGMIFASGYYPEVEDPRAYTQQFVLAAVERYKRDGREATIAYYNSPESIDGQWDLTMVNEQDGVMLANAVFPQRVGSAIPGVAQLGITEEGKWFPPHKVDNPLAPEKNMREEFAILHDGVIFVAGYYFSE